VTRSRNTIQLAENFLFANTALEIKNNCIRMGFFLRPLSAIIWKQIELFYHESIKRQTEPRNHLWVTLHVFDQPFSFGKSVGRNQK
jgi:hypothetical protein